MATRASVNQQAQIGPEATAGTVVPATRLLAATDIQIGVKSENKTHRTQGHKHTAVVTQGKEYVEAKSSGEADYDELIYPFVSLCGIGSNPTVPGGALTAKQWQFSPVLTGNATPKTFTVEKGDATTAEKFGYGLWTGVDLKFTRDSVDFSGDMIGQLISTGATLTPSLTEVALIPGRVMPL